MVTAEYKLAYSEVLEILNYISKEDFNKIPSYIIEMLKANSDNENGFKYNPEKTLKEQNVSELARTIIAILFRNYWATPEQKNNILLFQKNEREKIKQEKYNPNNLFKQSQQSQSLNENQIENTAMIEYKESLFKKILIKIKNFFRK